MAPLIGRLNFKKAERAAKMFLENLGVNLLDANLIATPRRMTQTYSELCRFLYDEGHKELDQELSKRFPTKYRGMIIQEPIRVYSLCSHHLLPVTYDVFFGYVPRDLTLGFSKSVKAITLLAAQPISQEDFTHSIVETLEKTLKPKGSMVVVRGIHMCMLIRGVKTQTVNVTSALRGVFKDEERTRNEFLTLSRFHITNSYDRN